MGLWVHLLCRPALALDLPKVAGKPLKLEVTETSILSQRFDAREGLIPKDHGWGAWLNKLNAQLTYGRFTLGTRLDSSLYWLRPEDRARCADCQFKPKDEGALLLDGSSRFHDSIYPAKLWASYKAQGVEITAGDAYAQFGRGLTLSFRKVDELGVDTTIRGVKVALQKDPVAMQLVFGFANPSRVDEATGTALFRTRPIPADVLGSIPVYGSDRVLGAEITAGRGGPIVLSTRGVRFTRCAPFAYDARGAIGQGLLSSPLGSCDAPDTETWLSRLPRGTSPVRAADEISLVSQSLEVPNLWQHGHLYVEAALMRRRESARADAGNLEGNALYAALTTNVGKLTNTLEIKSYRNFYPVAAAVETRASTFNIVQYNSPPTTEPLIQDSMFGFFNACVNGGRWRSDYRLAESLLVFGALGYYHTKSEVVGGGCDRFGRTLSQTGQDPSTFVWDGLTGFEWRFDKDRSQLLVSVGARDDRQASGAAYYNERALNYSFSLYLKGPFSVELAGRHRVRFWQDENLQGEPERSVPWAQGFHITALKVAPKWVFTQGIDYTTQKGFPVVYLNGGVLYRFTSESNLKLLFGQQQGGLRCANGVCRVFPAFEGARAELTLRF
jgi:Family of unknown function (DUF6029)